MNHHTQIIPANAERSSGALLPLPEGLITTRLATMEDLPFIDALQKKNSKQLGFFPRAQMEGYIKSEWVRVAMDEGGRAIGYCASRDRYLKRDELGVVFQLCVDETSQRKLIGASLLQSVFENSAYGARLYCCWCAQDLSANRFWEAMGFVPIAFRAGSEKKQRVHIFWQKRIRQEDESTPYWYPCQTGGGAIREDRIVLPIPDGVHWADVMPMVLPALSGVEGPGQAGAKQLAEKKPRKKKEPETPSVVVKATKEIEQGGLRWALPKPAVAPAAETKLALPKPKREKQKNDPKLIAFAREVRDRWQEHQESRPLLGCPKYEVARNPSPTLPPPETRTVAGGLSPSSIVGQIPRTPDYGPLTTDSLPLQNPGIFALNSAWTRARDSARVERRRDASSAARARSSWAICSRCFCAFC